MNETLKRLVAPLLLVCILASRGHAQKHQPISRQPLNDAASMNAQIFELPAGDRPFYFRVDLAGNNVLMIQFAKLSYWKEGSIPELFREAEDAWKQVQDSFRSATGSRRLSLHIPRGDLPVIFSIREWESVGRNMFLKDQQVRPLRIASDTLSVLKRTAGSGADPNRDVPIQYTFLLEDLGDIEKLVGDAELVTRISGTLDSLVTAKRKRWANQDAPYHSLEVLYDLRTGASGTAPGLSTVQSKTALSQFGLTGDLGASLVGGAISTFSSVRIYYKWTPVNSSETNFVGMGYTAIGFVKQEDNMISLRRLGFVNLEFGAINSGKSSPFPFSRTSIGIGYRVDAQDVGPYDFKYRFFFTYSPTRLITVTPDIYMIPKKNDVKSRGFIGVALSVRLL